MARQNPDEALPYYRWLWRDYRGSRKVQRMGYIARGLYRELLDECWDKGGIPDDIEALADICDCPVEVMAEAWPKIRTSFALVDGVLINEKLNSQRTATDKVRAARSAAGKSSAAKKAEAQDPASPANPGGAATLVAQVPTPAEQVINKSEQVVYSTSTSTSTSNSKDQGQNPCRAAGGPTAAQLFELLQIAAQADQKPPDPPEAEFEAIDERRGRGKAAQVREVFEFWKQTMQSPRSQLDAKRRGCIERAMAIGYSVEQCRAAIIGCSLTPHNMGFNDRATKFNGIDLIFRNADNIDRFIAAAHSPPRMPDKPRDAFDQLTDTSWAKGLAVSDPIADQIAAIAGPQPPDDLDYFDQPID